MKKYYVIISLGALIAWALVAGCSKAPNSRVGSSPVSTSDAGVPVELKARWVVGKRYDQEMTMKQQMHMDSPGMPKPVDSDTSIVMDFSLAVQKELPEGGEELEMTITGYKIESKANGKVALSFDSSQDTPARTNAATAVLAKMVGSHFAYQLDAGGKVTKVIGLEDFMARNSGGDPASQAIVKSMMNEDTLKQFAVRGQGLPDKPVKVGDHWPYHMDVNTGQVGKMKIELKYTFMGWQQHDDRKCALLEFAGDMATQPGTSTGPMNVSIEKGKISGDCWFDPELGMVVDSTSDTPMTVKMVMQGKPASMEMKQTVNVKLTEYADVAK
jgi:hypothetical protein